MPFLILREITARSSITDAKQVDMKINKCFLRILLRRCLQRERGRSKCGFD